MDISKSPPSNGGPPELLIKIAQNPAVSGGTSFETNVCVRGLNISLFLCAIIVNYIFVGSRMPFSLYFHIEEFCVRI